MPNKMRWGAKWNNREATAKKNTARLMKEGKVEKAKKRMAGFNAAKKEETARREDVMKNNAYLAKSGSSARKPYEAKRRRAMKQAMPMRRRAMKQAMSDRQAAQNMGNDLVRRQVMRDEYLNRV